MQEETKKILMQQETKKEMEDEIKRRQNGSSFSRSYNLSLMNSFADEHFRLKSKGLADMGDGLSFANLAICCLRLFSYHC
jgi:hypothetical protein